MDFIHCRYELISLLSSCCCRMGTGCGCPVHENPAKNCVVLQSLLKIGVRLQSSKAPPTFCRTVGDCGTDPTETNLWSMCNLLLHHSSDIEACSQVQHFRLKWLPRGNSGLRLHICTLHCWEQTVSESNGMLQFRPATAVISNNIVSELQFSNTG